jgi:cyclopropane fatty-acyl-phospholipid synthase-like methyltransferase
LYPTGNETLEQAELEMLESYVEKAELVDGMELLDLGCGWGSLSLFLAEVFHSLNTIHVEISRVKTDEFIKQSLTESIH